MNQKLSPIKNIDLFERYASIGLGGFLLLGPKPSGFLGIITRAVGLGLIGRGGIGYCPVYQSMGINAVEDSTKNKKYGKGTRDIVDEGSWESFPASDPPSYSRPSQEDLH